MPGLFLTPAENRVTARPVRIGLVGSGYRARTLLRVMVSLPNWFEVVGVAARNPADRTELAKMGFSAYSTLEHLIGHGHPDFVVSTLHAGDAQPVIAALAALGVPVLTETPAAGSVDELVALWELTQGGACIQVAEQYHLEPLVSAQLAVAASEMLGEVTDAYVSVAHDYHGISVMREALGVNFEEPLVTARRDHRHVFPSPSRYGDPEGIDLVGTVRTMAWFDFDEASGIESGPKLGIYDFDDAQYRSWVRSPSMVLRGPLGELRDEAVRMINFDDDDEHDLDHQEQAVWDRLDSGTSSGSALGIDGAGDSANANRVIMSAMNFVTAPEVPVTPIPITAHIERIAAGGAGSHEGLFLRGYQVFGESAYYNPFLPARLADDELAIAEMLARMGAHVLHGEPGPYSVAEAAQDKYLALIMHESARRREPIRATKQPWAAASPA